MRTNEEIYAALAEPFSESALGSTKKGGATLTYVPVSEVKARLNNVLGVTGWGEYEADAWIDPAHPDVVLAKTYVWINVNGSYSAKAGYGGQAIKKSKTSGEPVDLGDEFKGAHSDALKKAAQGHGVGLSLARSDDAIEQEARAAHQAEVRAAAAAPGASDEVKAAILEAIKPLDEDQRKDLKSRFAKNRIPRVEGEDFTEAHAELVAGWLKITL